MGHALRFFIEGDYTAGQNITLPDPLRHRLKKVLRLSRGDSIHLWNGKDGLWLAELNHDNLKTVELKNQLEAQSFVPKKHLFMGLTKRDAWETILRQATELGITDIHPIKTEFSDRDKTKPERAKLICTEASEQCERLDVPVLHPISTLKDAVSGFGNTIFWAAERGENAENIPAYTEGHGFLVGPEGGFSDTENDFLREQKHIISISLGPIILKADTAVVALLSKISL
jgi:16S rRNA (uracil1498-N3)-methyltransferase